MKTMPVVMLCALALSGLLGGCNQHANTPAQQAEPTPPVATDSPPPATPPAEPEPASPTPVPAPFAPAPKPGWIARATCHMGACTWNRYEQVARSGGDDAPRYALRITQGESRHAGDYPAGPDGVEIAWDAAQAAAEVRCSRTAPQASMADQGGTLALNPKGVSGVEQAIANLYFATCHGEYGNDAELAKKYGYDLR